VTTHGGVTEVCGSADGEFGVPDSSLDAFAKTRRGGEADVNGCPECIIDGSLESLVIECDRRRRVPYVGEMGQDPSARVSRLRR
jgi:hypothetical protein